MKRNFLLALASIITFTLSAQHNTIQTKIIDKSSKKPVEFASVRLLSGKDSTYVSGLTTDSTGLVTLKSIKNGNYTIGVSMVGYNNYFQNIRIADKDVLLPTIEIEEDSKLLKELEVTGTSLQVVAKGDTIEYNAAAFKTEQNAVVEDLLKKMPGVEITSDGKIMVNGEEIKKVRVDGKKFFGNDIEMSTKNIPADMIDRIQIVDQKSEMSQLSGFDDGETERIINLTIRKDKKQGVFGNVQAGAGLDLNPEFRYDANSFLNIMNNEVRSTITAGANNTNTMRSGRGRGGFFGGGRSGITATQNVGYNINSPLSTKTIIGGDVTFNHSDNLVISESERENYLQDGIFKNNSQNFSNKNNYQGNLRLEVEWKPDSLNTFIFQPNMGFTRSFSNSKSDYLYLMGNDSTSWGETDNWSNGLDINGGLNVIYNRKLSKPGRTLTTQINANVSQSEDNGMNISEKSTNDSTILLNQKNTNRSESFNFGVRMSYVEPLGTSKNHFLESVLSFNGNLRNSDRSIFDRDNNGNYDVKNSEYSNEFKNNFFKESLELNYKFVNPTYNMTFGLTAEPSQTYSTRTYSNNIVVPLKNEVINFAPIARLQYNFAKRNFARLDYRGRTNQPSINQMQPVKNNTDLMNETVGNPTLNPEFNHFLRLMYTKFNATSLSSFSVGMFGNLYKDKLTTNSIYDKTGKRYIQTINSKETPYSANIFTMYNQPFLKKFNFSNRLSMGVRQQYGYTSRNVNLENIDLENLILGDLSSTIRYNTSENISLSFTHEIVDVALNGGINYSNSQNNFNTKNTETYDWTSGLNLGLRPTKKLTFTSTMNFTKQSGYGDFNPSQLIWNAGVELNSFKGKGVLSLKVFDLLRQQQNIIQTVGENYIEFSSNNALSAYFLVGFTYKINKFKGGNDKDRETLENMNNNQQWGPPHPNAPAGRGAGRPMFMPL